MVQAYESLTKDDLHQMADRLLSGESAAIEAGVSFFEASTKGLWHNRARAMMARRFKHCQLEEVQQRRLVSCILKRLLGGESAEQFRDQLRLGLHLDAPRFFGAASVLANDPRRYMSRLAGWILDHDKKGQ